MFPPPDEPAVAGRCRLRQNRSGSVRDVAGGGKRVPGRANGPDRNISRTAFFNFQAHFKGFKSEFGRPVI